ncbi:hypothetical protein BROUX41_005280 [Berkeleyomyces rouxiae]|uniref:uncharacterized protein n=1 Tax=Berkeleyomyces rouxiae TaxID=2035830 RepID=UPI003B7A1B63
MSSSTTTTATAAFPAMIRFLLTTFEPLTALNGVYLALFDPPAIAQLMTRQPAPAGAEPLTATTVFLFSGLAGGWLLHAALGAGVLRAVDDARVWRGVCAAMLLSDAVFVHATMAGIGGLRRWADVAAWSATEAAANAVTFGMLAVRVWVVLGGGGKEKSL